MEGPLAPDGGRRRPLAAVGAALLLLLLGLQLYLQASRWDATMDEPVHLVAGYAHLSKGDLRLNPEHPPLVKWMAAVPVAALRPSFPVDRAAWDAAEEWEAGEAFVYRNRIPPAKILRAGRLPMVLLTLLLGALIFAWARRWHGDGGGLLAAGLFAASPFVMAHGALVTTDMAAALFYAAVFYGLWRLDGGGGRGWMAWVALAGGGAALSRFPGVLAMAGAGVVVLVRMLRRPTPEEKGVPRPWTLWAGVLAAMALAWVLLADLFYASPGGIVAYARGVAQVGFNHAPGRLSFLAGDLYHGGRPVYYLAAFLLKSPLSFLAALALAAILPGGGGLKRMETWLFLLGPAALWGMVTASATPDNIGFRHALAVLPLLFVWAGGLAPALWRSRRRVAAAAVLCILAAGIGFEGWSARSDPMAFFNAASGPGYRWLADSNLDWGQWNGEALRRLDGEAGASALLFGPSPAAHGSRVPGLTDAQLARPSRGTWAVSAHHLASRAGLRWLREVRPLGRIGRGVFLYRWGDGDGDRPVEYCAAALARRPEDPFLWSDCGAVHGARGEWAEAEREFAEALRLDPAHPTARASRAEALFALKRDGEARDELEEDLANFPFKLGHAVRLAEGRFRSGDLEGALRALERVPDHAANLDGAHGRQIALLKGGFWLLGSGQPRAARIRFADVLSRDHCSSIHRATALIGLGQARAALGDQAGAERALRDAVELKPGLAAARYALGMLIARDPARVGEATEQWRAALAVCRDPAMEAQLLEALARAGASVRNVDVPPDP